MLVWATTKKACLDKDRSNTGLYKHFKTGCPADQGNGDLGHLTWTLIDFVSAGHQGGPKCRCSECLNLKDTEDKWICRLGTFYGANVLNTRDEIKTKSRVNFKGS